MNWPSAYFVLFAQVDMLNRVEKEKQQSVSYLEDRIIIVMLPSCLEM